ncbi:MAG: hypothetical protein ACK4S4_05220 [Pyrinomonadaceae bacterium]
MPSNLRRRILTVHLLAAIALSMSGCGRLFTPEAETPNMLGSTTTLAGFKREFGEPFGIAYRDGEIFVSDGERGRVVKIDRDGAMQTLAEDLRTPSAIALYQNGDLVVAETGAHCIRKISADGSMTVVAGVPGVRGAYDGPASEARFNGPIGVAADAEGRVFVADTYNDRIRVIDGGVVRTLAGGVRGFADGEGSAARFDTPLGLAALAGGGVLVADSMNGRIRVVDQDGRTATLAGDGVGERRDGTLASSSFEMPTAVSVAANGAVFVADGNAIRAIGRRSFPLVETVAGGPRGFIDGRAMRARFNRPSGIAVTEHGDVIVADADNQAIRMVGDNPLGAEISAEHRAAMRYSAEEFRSLQPPRWPFDPPSAKREIAGTLGEVRGEVTLPQSKPVWFHNGLDIAGGYGETALFIRGETVLEPAAVENLGALRELIRLPTLGYIHIRIGRDRNDRPFADDRFQFERDAAGKITNLRVPRGSVFNSGERIGTLNAFNHVHLVAGRVGAEMNAIDALSLPGLTDSIAPVIESVRLTAPDWQPVETSNKGQRIRLAGKTRVVARAYDRVDGNAARRRLGVYKLGWQIVAAGGQPTTAVNWTIVFDRMPPNEAVGFVYAPGSRSGYTPETIFDYVVTNLVSGDTFSQGFIDPAGLAAGTYKLRVFAADRSGNTAVKELEFEVTK